MGYYKRHMMRGGELDNELILRQFDEIENKLEKVVAVCKSYEGINLELNNKIVKLEKELQGKIEEEKSYSLERNIIRSKIDNLLSKFDGITEAHK
jgi:translation initiation factor 2 beta subunit (eIF-2beta)/eIF-5